MNPFKLCLQAVLVVAMLPIAIVGFAFALTAGFFAAGVMLASDFIEWL